jgi:hypothetical protein
MKLQIVIDLIEAEVRNFGFIFHPVTPAVGDAGP